MQHYEIDLKTNVNEKYISIKNTTNSLHNETNNNGELLRNFAIFNKLKIASTQFGNKKKYIKKHLP